MRLRSLIDLGFSNSNISMERLDLGDFITIPCSEIYLTNFLPDYSVTFFISPISRNNPNFTVKLELLLKGVGFTLIFCET